MQEQNRQNGWRIEVEEEDEDEDIRVFSDYVEAVKFALEDRKDDDVVSICRGPDRCSEEDKENGPCPFCYVVEGADDRTPEEILRVVLSGN